MNFIKYCLLDTTAYLRMPYFQLTLFQKKGRTQLHRTTALMKEGSLQKLARQ